MTDQLSKAKLLTLVEKLNLDSRRKDDYLVMIAHEIRNPLAPIQLAIDLLTKDPKRNNAEELLGLLNRQTQHLRRLTTDLIEAIRVNDGRVRVEVDKCDLVQIVGRILKDNQGSLEKVGLALVIDLPTVPVYAMVDSMRIAQVLGNILDNAAKFTPRGGAVFVDMQSSNGLCTLNLRDTGIGMTPEILDTLFEYYTQGDMSSTRPNRGLGLGMSIARTLVQDHGGTLTASSEGSQRGSIFTITLPTVE